MTAVDDAFRCARIHAARHMAACEQARLRWNETSITEIVMARAAQAVTVVPFTQRAEALSGADWVWWWMDDADAYGMLVQAKRLTVKEGKWSFDFGYKGRRAVRAQREALRSTAATLGLLPVYALYLGTDRYRRPERCSDDHQSGRCLPCVKRTISLMPALLADERLVRGAASTYKRSVALEDVRTPPLAGAPLIPALKEQLASELVDFLQKPQDGIRAVARSMIDQVLRVRFGRFRAVPTSDQNWLDADLDDVDPAFEKALNARRHRGLKYIEHTLNPLRHTPPDYVHEIITVGHLDEGRLASRMPDNVAGTVVVRLPQHE